MKYIFKFLWLIVCILLVSFYCILFIFINLVTIIWNLNFRDISNWSEFTEIYHPFTGNYYAYDKNPYETFIRFLTNGDFKNERRYKN